MTFEQAIAEIRTNASYERRLMRSRHGNYICPQCRSGEGTNKTGALSIDRNTNKFKCFACNWHGDYIDFLQGTENIDFAQAVSMAANELGIEINGQNEVNYSLKDKQPDKDNKTAETDDFNPITADYTAYYKQCAERLTDAAALSYLEGRGISAETVKRFGVGYDCAADPATAPGAMGNEFKAHPTARLIFPTSKSHYVARSIDKETPKGFKALNVKGGGVQIWNKSAIYSGGVVFVCEGVFTALSVIECGHKAIAVNSENNGNLLLRALDEQPSNAKFVVCFDNDTNEETNKRTKMAAKGLNEQIQARNYTSIVFDIAAYCKDGETDLNDILQRDRATVQKIIKAAENEINRDYLTDFLETVQTEAYRPYKTGLPFFDELLGGGVIKQTLLLLMAAPAAGKTTLCQQIAEEMAARQKPVIYLNFEMSREQMLAKSISSRLAKRGINKSATDILQGYNWKLDEKAIIEEEISHYRADIYPYLKYNPDNVTTDLNKLLAYLNTIGEQSKAAGSDAPAVVVDYLHLISSNEGIENQELIKQTVTGLKNYAKNHNTFVIGIVAVNREAMKKGQLSMNSGRDSSNIEYTADYAITLNYWDVDQEKIDPQKEKEMAALYNEPWRRMVLRLAKSRFSASGKHAKVYFNAASNYFTDGMGFIPEGAISFNAEPLAKQGKRL